MFENANVNAKMKMQTLPMSLQNIDITTLLGHYQYQIKVLQSFSHLLLIKVV